MEHSSNENLIQDETGVVSGNVFASLFYIVDHRHTTTVYENKNEHNVYSAEQTIIVDPSSFSSSIQISSGRKQKTVIFSVLSICGLVCLLLVGIFYFSRDKPIATDITVYSTEELLNLPKTVKMLTISSNCCNDTIPEWILSDYPQLESITVGDGSLINVQVVSLKGTLVISYHYH